MADPTFPGDLTPEEIKKWEKETSGPDPAELNQRNLQLANLKATYAETVAQAKLLNAQLKDTNLNVKEALDVQENLVAAKRAEIKAMLDLQTANEELTKDQLARFNITQKMAEELVGQTIAGKEIETIQEAITALLVEQEKSLRLVDRYYRNIDEGVKGVAGKIGLTNKFQDSFLHAIMKTKDGVADTESGFERVHRNLKNVLHPAEIGYAIFTKWVTTMIEFNQEVYKANIELNKATGMASEFKGDIAAVSHDFYFFGQTLEQAAEATGALVGGFTEFTTLGANQRQELEALTTRFTAVGVSTDDFATGLTVLTRNMGMSRDQAVGLNKDLVTYALSIGMAPSKFMKEFALAIPKLSVYGDRAVDIFRKLELRSKATGMSIEQLTNVTAKMDTFEGAAEVAGRLNAALGGSYFDSLELLMADENERLDIIRETINASGLQFNQLGRFEQRMLANAAGIESAAEMQRLLNGETSKHIGVQREWQEVTDASASISNSLNVAWKSMAHYTKDIIEPINNLLKSMTRTKEGARALGLAISAFTLALGVALVFGASFSVIFGSVLIAVVAVVGAIVWLSDELEKISKVGFENLTVPEQSKVKTGSAMAGALSGAAIGTAIAPGIGTLIGGAIGGAAGYALPQVMHDGGTASGGATVLQQGEMLANLDGGTFVTPTSKTNSIFADLAKGISELRDEIKQNNVANRQPIPVVLKSTDDRILAKTVIKNLNYQT